MYSTRAAIIAAVVLLLVHVLVLARFGGHESVGLMSDTVQFLLGSLCALTSFQAFRRSGSTARYFWRWLVVAFLMWMVSQALGIYIDISGNAALGPIDDLFFFCSQVPLGMLIFLDPDHEPNHFDRLHLLDFVQICAFTISIYLFFSRGPGGLTTISLLGPFGWTRSLAFDGMLITSFALRATLADSVVVRKFFGRMTLFLVCGAFADSYSDFSPNELHPGHWFDLVWSVLLTIPLIVAATWNQKESPASPVKASQSFVVNQFFPLLYPFFSFLLLAQLARRDPTLASIILVVSFAALGTRTLVFQHRLARTRETLEFQASHDALTGLWNRGAIVGTLEEEIQRHKRSGEPLGVMMADVDFFKKINDNYGHFIGDVVLQEVAAQLSTALRLYDSVGRYGGEEFLILTPSSDRSGVVANAERLRRSLLDFPIPTSFGPVSVTVTLGVVSARGNELSNSSDLLRMADDALYAAKRLGRNRVELAETALAWPPSKQP
jgi:diguanylate cyclase (GGDEF)-like protein